MTVDERDREARGIVLNTVGANANVWIRRITLAHELAHVLYDPEADLENVRIDSYSDNQRPSREQPGFRRARANAFAVAFLAPNEAVRILSLRSDGRLVAKVMSTLHKSYFRNLSHTQFVV